jgi:hypothetical protein
MRMDAHSSRIISMDFWSAMLLLDLLERALSRMELFRLRSSPFHLRLRVMKACLNSSKFHNTVERVRCSHGPHMHL